MADFGYDVSDYRDVDPIFGTLADFDALDRSRARAGVKVIIDLVWAHTSDRHPWFEESRASRDQPRADWYVWARSPSPTAPRPTTGSRCSAARHGPGTRAAANITCTTSSTEQPQLNGHHPAVQQALLDVARFWFERGIDGFRIDAINFMMFDPGLPTIRPRRWTTASRAPGRSIPAPHLQPEPRRFPVPRTHSRFVRQL
jgi:alpha-glucosidase